jgi:AcrR family transcriptional regulator
MSSGKSSAEGRNRGFKNTHQQMIETAVRLISEKGIAALSVASLAREMGLNRTTVYYHFETREAMVAAVKAWSSKQLASAFQLTGSRAERIDYIGRFVLENPELIKLWVEDFVSPGDIRDSYPHWDKLVKGVAGTFAKGRRRSADAEIFCVILLAGAIIGPRVFRNRVRSEVSAEDVVRRFREEWQRILRAVGF